MSTSDVTPRGLPSGIEESQLSRAVGVLLGARETRLTEWRCTSIWEPRVVQTQGVFLISGTALDEGRQEQAWSVVLKVLASTQNGSPPLEAFLYDSGFLASLSHGLVAPRCLGVDQLHGGDTGVWLEHVTDATGPTWPIARFAVAARHLGEFSAAQTADGELPERPWLRRGDLRAGLAAGAARLDSLREHLEHPLVKRAYPSDVAKGLLRAWEERESFLAALDHVPGVVCHGDAQRRNLFARDLQGADTHTVAIDWTNLRAWQVGMDVKTLVHQALMYFDTEVDSVHELDTAVFGGYVEGLRAGGWRGDTEAVRIGYAMPMALGSGIAEIGPILRMALDESRRPRDEAIYGRSVGEILDRRAAIGRFSLELMAEARALL